jgi:Peroxiredoxin
MSIKVGDKVPNINFTTMTADGPAPVGYDDLFAGKRVALFSVPGAFTPTCSLQHLPGFIQKASELTAKGIDTIACMAVNDVFVMDAWGKSQHADGKIMMLADGNGEFTSAIGLELDASGFGMGTRGQRFSLVNHDGEV